MGIKLVFIDEVYEVAKGGGVEILTDSIIDKNVFYEKLTSMA